MLHARQTTSLDAYDLYELEHMPRTTINVTDFETQSVRAKSHAPDRDQLVKPGAGKGKKGRYFWSTRKEDSVDICGKSVDAEAEKFIEFEHEKFELSKWMSID